MPRSRRSRVPGLWNQLTLPDLAEGLARLEPTDGDNRREKARVARKKYRPRRKSDDGINGSTDGPGGARDYC
jgi:hypothetical protein